MKKVTQSKSRPSKRLFVNRLCDAASLYLADGNNQNVKECLRLIKACQPVTDITLFWKEAESLDLFLPPVRLTQK